MVRSNGDEARAAPGDGAAFSMFDTAIGRCAIVWRGGRLVATYLPEERPGGLRGAIMRRFPDAAERPSGEAPGDAAAAMRALLDGGDADLSAIPLDWRGVEPFDRAVLDAASRIPRGETRTYGEIAAALGGPGAARAVGGALGRNPFPVLVPCHRVVAASGRSGGFSAPGGASTKMRILSIEQARRSAEPSLFEALPWQVRG